MFRNLTLPFALFLLIAVSASFSLPMVYAAKPAAAQSAQVAPFVPGGAAISAAISNVRGAIGNGRRGSGPSMSAGG